MAQAELSRPLPHSIDAERSVLGAILLDNAALVKASETLKSSDFFLSQNSILFAAMLAMHDAGTPIDLVTLPDFLHNKGELERAGGAAYLASLVDGVPKISNVGHYAGIVREKAQRRHIIHLTHALQEKALSDEETAADMFEHLRLAAQDSIPARNGNGIPHARSIIEFLTTEFPVPEHLIEGLIARGGTAMFFSKPHRLKSWLLMALAFSSTRAGKILGGKLEIVKPVRTLLLTIEDPPSQVKDRLMHLLGSPAYQGIDQSMVKMITRDMVPGFHLPGPFRGPDWHKYLVAEILAHQADHVILDVLRKILRPGMDINKPSDSGEMVHELESLHDETGAAITLAHHQKKGDADMMDSASGSGNFVSWSKILVRFDQKTEEKQPRQVTMVEMETDNAWVSSLEPMRLILDTEAHDPLRLEGLEEGSTVLAAKYKLANEWTLRDLAEASDSSRTTAWRRLQRWRDTGVVEKIQSSKPTRGGMARFHFITPSDSH